MIPVLDAATELSAINSILKAGGDFPCDSLEELSPEGINARTYLDRQRGSILAKRWDFNSDYGVDIVPSTEVLTEAISSYEDTSAPIDVTFEHTKNYYGGPDYPVPAGSYTLTRKPSAEDEQLLLYFEGQVPSTGYNMVYTITDNGTFISYAFACSQYAGYSISMKREVLKDDMPSGNYFQPITFTEDDKFGYGSWPDVDPWTFAMEAPRYDIVQELVVTPATYISVYELPSDTLLAVPTDRMYQRRWVQRGTKMYDRQENTYEVVTPFKLDLAFLVDFNDMPLPFRDWVAYTAGAEYLDDQANDTALADRWLGKAQRARMDARSHETSTGCYSVNTRPSGPRANISFASGQAQSNY